MYDIHKNSLISSGTYTDLAGHTDCTYPSAGERELGLDAETGAELAALNAVLSVTLVCDCCGVPVKKKADLTRIKGFNRCKECRDKE